MADIGKQEGVVKPLPAPQRARTINIAEFQQYYRNFQEGNFHQYLENIFSNCRLSFTANHVLVI
ncbi:hypothetical protein GLOIN_2v1681985 [Rhizophagus irregularis DAOM 181602=DAOM 197198]|uniref:Uncharacterized protein n=1 Tax=Rhizophagus irregularis (strain DAOM 181602 / DAOM 197198 / MUCL 43194) TaxID=747089 RepID=A0A2P4PER3_RHIID|nr:hypothetical protein GLOIN_2v1681985 [Rhizophagus irregularis DAOM 181602=DAOM 197198]POG63867.1 hypothetical protein GLOIN_2v1681985 [Rhizophagus irregularis DAOM 181602=DAOM 197198]|eukprot:XP_025170733.1 hypothetical protein GLOIN_2v1681985 [Rhizophagus irregularis DAOM 181602=DAOM 197198]